MKKILVLILALVMCLTALTSCDQIKGAVGGVVDQVKEFVDGIINPGEETPAVTETQADDAITLLKNDYKEYEKNGTPGDVKGLPTVMMQGDVTVSWTIESNAEYVTLVTVPGEKGNPDTVTIDVNTDIDYDQDVAYTVTAKIVDANNVERTHTFNFFIPKFKPSTHEDYMAAKSGDTLTIEGIVVALNSVSAGNKRNHIFLSDVDGKGGYYCYNMTSDPITDGIQVGMTVRISGNMSPSNGMQELYQANFVKIIDSTIKTVDPIDITNLFVSGGNLDAYVGHSVTIKGVTLGGQSFAVETDQYLYFTLNDKESYIRTYYTDLPHTLVTPTGDKANKLAIEADHAAHYGWTADVTGILVYYSGSPYLIPTSVNCFTNYVEPQRTDAEKVELEAGRLSLPENVGEDTVITLPLTGVSYDEVKIAWTCPEADYVTYDATTGKLTIVLPAEATTLTLSYTITLNDATKTGTVEIAVDAAATDVYVPENVETPAADKAYKFYLAQNNRGEVLYFAGEMSGNFLATTTRISKATDVYLETVEGGFRLYFKNADGEKVYIDAHEYQTGKVGVRLTGEPTCVWTFDADLGVLTTVVIEKTWYLGTYNTFNTMSLSETWRISGEKAGDVGVSQFPAYLANVVAKEVAPENVETPAADKAYKFYLAQNNRGEVLYFAGEMSGNFLATTTRISKATDVYLETVEGGFRLYFKNADGEKVYIDAHEYQTGKVGVRLTGEPTCVWTFDADLGVLTTVVIEKTWYLGTYNTFNTMSLSETWRISGEKAGDVGVSQFPAYLATIEFVKEEVETPEHTHTACTECGKCTAEDCTGEKCEGHEEAPTHTHTPCATCNLCTAADCTGEASEKCAGHVTIYTTAEEIINAAYALAEGETLSNGHNYTLTGLIQSVDTAYNSQFSNVTVTILVDGTNKTIQCFRLKGTGADVIKVGDTITVTGVIKNYYGKIEFDAGCTLDSYVPGAPVETTGVVLSFASTSARTEFDTSKQVWENGALKLTNDKASSTSNVADYYGPARFYKNSTITIEYADGIKTLTFTCDSQAKYQLTSGVGISVEGATIVQNGAVTTITFAEPVTSVTITLSVQQVRINTLEVNK